MRISLDVVLIGWVEGKRRSNRLLGISPNTEAEIDNAKDERAKGRVTCDIKVK